MTVAQKGGPLGNQETPVCPHDAGSHSFERVSVRALFDVLGHEVARFPDGRTVQVTPYALKIIDIPLSHEALNA